MNWAWDNRRMLAELLSEHMYLAFVPLLIGFLIAVPLGLTAARLGVIRRPVLQGLGVAYAVPTIALLVLLPGVFGIRIDDRVNILAALTFFSAIVLGLAVADGLAQVPAEVRHAADALGHARLSRLLRIEWPLAVPTVVAGLRVAAMSNISLVSLGALFGVGGLGTLFTEAFVADFATEATVGLVMIAVLAFVADQFLLRVHMAFSSWTQPVALR